jgi:hypothetical protein
MPGTYKFYIGRCVECDKEDFFPIYLYKNSNTSTCEYCGGTVYIDKSETFKGKIYINREKR